MLTPWPDQCLLKVLLSESVPKIVHHRKPLLLTRREVERRWLRVAVVVLDQLAKESARQGSGARVSVLASALCGYSLQVLPRIGWCRFEVAPRILFGRGRRESIGAITERQRE
jgi:hypothetical protein